jgi:hypothetical protein
VSAAQTVTWTVPAALIVISDYVLVRWLLMLTSRTREQGERIAHLEGRNPNDPEGG